MFYWVGLLLVALSWLGGAVLLRKWHDKDFTTISKHAASSLWAHILFASLLVAGGALFYAWIVAIIAPDVSYPPLFVSLLTLATALQMATAIIPDKPGWQRTVHRYTAWSMAVLWIPLVTLLALSTSLPGPARIVSLLCGLYMVVTLLVVVGLHKGRFLIYQALYVVAFQLALLGAAYL